MITIYNIESCCINSTLWFLAPVPDYGHVVVSTVVADECGNSGSSGSDSFSFSALYGGSSDNSATSSSPTVDGGGTAGTEGNDSLAMNVSSYSEASSLLTLQNLLSLCQLDEAIRQVCCHPF